MTNQQPPTHDEIARDVIGKWIGQFGDLFSPGTRAAALLTISRVAGEMANEEEAKIPDLWD